MSRIDIKPLSVNDAWKGRRFKTDAYKQYEQDLGWLLPKSIFIPAGDLLFTLEIGLSNAGADIDNPVKPFLDVLQKKYGFNDKRVTELRVKKRKVKKGEEYIDFYFGSAR